MVKTFINNKIQVKSIALLNYLKDYMNGPTRFSPLKSHILYITAAYFHIFKWASNH